MDVFVLLTFNPNRPFGEKRWMQFGQRKLADCLIILFFLLSEEDFGCTLCNVQHS